MGERTTVIGTILAVVFQNEENGYAVLRLVTDDGELLTLVGCVPCAAPGENLTATGSISSVGPICGIFWATSRGDGSGTSLAVLHEESSNPVSYHPAISFLAS